jgi:hypothetical protein
MKILVPITAAVVALSLLTLGCRKKREPEETNQTAAPEPPPPPPPPPPKPTATTPGPGEVAHYPDEVPMGSVTVELLQQFTVHQAADLNSPVLTTVGRGVYINIKATHSNWMLIEYPSGVGQLSPGWIDLRNVYDRRVRLHKGKVRPPARLPPKFHKR